MAVGVVATNTGNNLLYLVLSMMLAGIVVSGLLSEQSLRRVTAHREMTGPIFELQVAFGRLVVRNRKRRLRSFSLRVREIGPKGACRHLAYLPHLAPDSEARLGYQVRFDRRGPARLAEIQTTTIFPFGLFLKASQPEASEEVLVLPRIEPLPADLVQALGEAGVAARPTRGPGTDLHDLRLFRVGDDPRLIHWKQSAKLGQSMVRELETEEGGRISLALEDPVSPPRESEEVERLEQDIRFAASLAAHLLHAGGEVELCHRDTRWPALRGETGLLRLLEYLARYVPAASGEAIGPAGVGDPMPNGATTVTVWLGRALAVIPGYRGEGRRLVRVVLPAQEVSR